MKPSLRDKKGMVLILVLSVVVLFTAMIYVFKSDQSMELDLAYNFRDSLQSQYLGSAGVGIATYLLTKNDDEYDADDEDWAKFKLGLIEATSQMQEKLPNCSLDGDIFDECAKLDLNSLVWFDETDNKYKLDDFRKAQLKKLMITVLEIDIREDEFDELVDSICDWIDPDSDKNTAGAEDEYYTTLPEPYECKNGPMDTPEEILLVKGMEKEWFYGEENKYKGIGEFVTVGTKGTVNVNTASKEVLWSLTENMTESMVEEVMKLKPIKDKSQAQKYLDIFKTLTTDEQNFLNNSIPNHKYKVPTVDIKSRLFSVSTKGLTPSGSMVYTKAKLLIDNNTPIIVYYKIY